MTLYISNRDGDGKTDEKGHYKFPGNAFAGTVVFPGLVVAQNSPVGMSIKVASGDFRIDTGNGYSYTGWSSSDTVLTVTTANPANARIDTVVVYVDKTAATSPSPPNNPGIAKFAVIAGTPAPLPVAPNSTAIQTQVGAGNPYIILANIAVAAAATAILNANVTDLRVPVSISTTIMKNSLDMSIIGPLVYPVGAVYFNASSSTSPAVLFGFGTWVQLKGVSLGGISDVSGSSFNVAAGTIIGEEKHTMTRSELVSHWHQVTSRMNFDTGAQAGSMVNIQQGAGGGSSYYNVAVTNVTNTAGNNISMGALPTGASTPFNVIQRTLVGYMWQRTA